MMFINFMLSVYRIKAAYISLPSRLYFITKIDTIIHLIYTTTCILILNVRLVEKRLVIYFAFSRRCELSRINRQKKIRICLISMKHYMFITIAARSAFLRHVSSMNSYMSRSYKSTSKL